jgi:hypothetical protein
MVGDKRSILKVKCAPENLRVEKIYPQNTAAPESYQMREYRIKVPYGEANPTMSIFVEFAYPGTPQISVVTNGSAPVVYASNSKTVHCNTNTNYIFYDSFSSFVEVVVLFEVLQPTTQVMSAIFECIQNTTPNLVKIIPVPADNNVPSYINYTLDGSTPTPNSTYYIHDTQITIKRPCQVRAIITPVHKDLIYNNKKYVSGITASAQYEVVPYTFTPLKIKFTPPEGELLRNPQMVALSVVPSNVPATIYYTVNGDDPTTQSAKYVPGTLIRITQPTMIKALAVPVMPSQIYPTDIKYTNSEITTASYTQIGACIPPRVSGYVSSSAPVLVSLASGVPGTQIRYTTDGSAPTMSSPLYSTPISMGSATTLRVTPFVNGVNTYDGVDFVLSCSNSEAWIKYKINDNTLPTLVSSTYTVPLMIYPSLVSPSIYLRVNPFILSYNFSTSISIWMGTDMPGGAIIRYTTDGSAPTTTSRVYNVNSPIVLTQTTTVRAIAMLSSLSRGVSLETKKTYTLGGTSSIVDDATFINGSNIVTTDLGLQVKVGSYAGGYACAMFTPRFPRTITNGEVAGKFEIIGLVSALSTESTIILLAEELYGSLLCTITLDDSTQKYFRSYSNGKIWTDVSGEFV